MNNVNLIGRLVRDVDLKYMNGKVGNNTAIARFTLAVDKELSREKKQEFEQVGKQTADFINIVVFGLQAENASKYIGKGRKVAITGRLQSGSYEKDGQTIYTTDVLASSIEYLDFGDNRQQAQQPADDEDFTMNADFDTSDGRIPF